MESCYDEDSAVLQPILALLKNGSETVKIIIPVAKQFLLAIRRVYYKSLITLRASSSCSHTRHKDTDMLRSPTDGVISSQR